MTVEAKIYNEVAVPLTVTFSRNPCWSLLDSVSKTEAFELFDSSTF